MSRATDDLMDRLHEMTAQSFLEEIERIKQMGEGIPPALLTAAAKFLKDNGVDRPQQDGNSVDELASKLPSLAEVAKFPGAL